MEFIVPQFIEREGKIVGPLTFKQFIFVVTACGIAALLYFILPFPLFLVMATFLVGGSLGLVFIKIEVIPLLTIIKNIFVFSSRPKIYLWQKKHVFPKIIRKVERTKVQEEKKESPLKITEKSRLRDLFTYLESRTK